MQTNKKAPYPMLMEHVPREIIWGGTKLREKYGKDAPFPKIAESWELSCRDDAVSRIANGEYAGMPLNEYLGGKAEGFPLLIKFIDAGERLSVQVHPDDTVCDNVGRSLGKTEMWYIIEADEGAQLVYGLKDGVTLEDFARAVDSGRTEECLNFVNVSAGDVFFIPAGQIHAIGERITLAEIQQNSDTTYRIYDYGRRDKNGNQRQLHIDEALRSIKLRSEQEIEAVRFSRGRFDNCIASCDKFTSCKYEICGTRSLSIGDFGAIICVGGGGTVIHKSREYKIKAGDTYFIPESCGEFTVSGNLTIITAEVKNTGKE